MMFTGFVTVHYIMCFFCPILFNNIELGSIAYFFNLLPFIRFCSFVSLSFSEKRHQAVKLDASTVEIEERGVKLRLTVVDTPGYGDAIDNTDRFVITISYSKIIFI